MAELVSRLEELPVIGIVRRCPPERLTAVVRAAMDEGLRVVEITFDSVGAASQIASVRDAFPDALVGAGTVTGMDELEAAVVAGARFIVTPVLAEEVASACAGRRIPCVPGASTPTEIWAAARLGVTAVKVFPATQLGGPPYIRALREPLEGVRMVPTGGVTARDVPEYLEAGAWAIGVGSAVFARSWMADGDTRSIGRAMAEFRRVLG